MASTNDYAIVATKMVKIIASLYRNCIVKDSSCKEYFDWFPFHIEI